MTEAEASDSRREAQDKTAEAPVAEPALGVVDREKVPAAGEVVSS